MTSKSIPVWIAWPLSECVEWVTEARNFLYDRGVLDSIQISKPVVSVGNISMGGTGKTPFVAKLIEMCLERNLRPAVISRNYKAKSRGIYRVQVSGQNHFDPAQFFGDEPTMLSRAFPTVPIFTGPEKYKTAMMAEKHAEFDILIVDDGFQHRMLKRDFDVVLVDCSTESTELKIFPLGCLREGFSALERANCVILTKTEQSQPQNLDWIKSQIPSGLDLVQSKMNLQIQVTLEPAIAVAGIAKPENFYQSLRTAGVQIRDCLTFADHYPYSSSSVDQLISAAKKADVSVVYTTEKDFVKLVKFEKVIIDHGIQLRPVKMEFIFLTYAKGLNEFLDRCAGY